MSNLSFGDTYSRRLPIYILIDCSESMIGEPLEAVYLGISQLINDLRNDPVALETAWLSFITFSGKARQIIPLTDISEILVPSLSVGPGTSLGAALKLLSKCINLEIKGSTPLLKGDWRPIIFILTDGIPTDNWRDGLIQMRSSISSPNIIAVGCGEDVDIDVLKEITTNILVIKSTSSGDLKKFFKWVSSSISTASVSVNRNGQNVNLPAPPIGVIETLGNLSINEKNINQPTQIILAARCQDKKSGYLMRYRRISPSVDIYQAENAYKVGEDYFGEASIGMQGKILDSSKLKGSPPCPYCGRPGWAFKEGKTELECSEYITHGGRRAQVLFILDVTGSMSGEIKGVKDSIDSFLNYIKAEGLSVQVGLIAFRDLTVNELPQVLTFGKKVFTDNIDEFKLRVSELKAKGGGGNAGESSFDAIALACKQKFDNDLSRILILITDQHPLLPDGEISTIDSVISKLKNANIDQLYIVAPERVQSDFEPLLIGMKGQIFELGADGRGSASFRKILLNIGKGISVATRVG